MAETSSEPAVGIDLGTTHSVIARLDETGRPQTIENAEGDATTPSGVLFDRSSPIAGQEAVQVAAVPRTTGRSAENKCRRKSWRR